MIPKVHHTVWTSSDAFSEKYHRWRLSWMQHNPDWSFRFWTIHEIARECSDVPDSCVDVLSDFDIHHVYKSDIARLVVVFYFGGVYSDTDVECLRPMPDYVMKYKSFCGKCITPGIGTTFLFGAEKNSRFLYEIADETAKSILSSPDCGKKYDCETSNNLMGRLLLRNSQAIFPEDLFNPFGNYNEKYRHPSQEFLREKFPNSCCIHHWTGQDPDGWNGKQ
jgi:hypothetical protein